MAKKKVFEIGQVPKEALADVSCPHFGICGGCSFLNVSYEYELGLKRGMVAELLADYWQGFPDVVPAPSPVGYRNKMEFSFGDNGVGGELALGIRKKRQRYEVAVPADCAIIPDDFKTVLLATLEFFRGSGEAFYHKMRRTGTLRYLVLRRGEFTGEILVNLVTTSGLADECVGSWLTALGDCPLHGKIVGVLHTVSDGLADAVVPDEVRVLFGRGHFFERLCGLDFMISPFSFFQTYSGTAELLYGSVAEFAAGWSGAAGRSGAAGQAGVIYDLYCGTGTIAQVLAPFAREVIGVELVAEAVDAAAVNARENGIGNCRFVAGDVLEVLSDNEFPRPDVMVLDPPRAGIHPKALPRLIELGAGKIVYVSCKPSSLARDMAVFAAGGYCITDIRLHDLFPRTPHVETIVLLQKA